MPPGLANHLGPSCISRCVLPQGSRNAGHRRLPENEARIQDLLTEAASTWGDRLIGRGKTGSINQTEGRALCRRRFRRCTSRRSRRWTPSTTSRSSKSCKTIRSSWSSMSGDDDGIALLTWYLGGRSASLCQLLPMLQSHGRRGARGAALHSDPPRRTAGVDLPVQGVPASHHPEGAGSRGRAPTRSAVRRRGHRDLARPRRDRPVQRAGAAGRSDLAAGRRAAHIREIPTAGGFSVQPVPHRSGDQR